MKLKSGEEVCTVRLLQLFGTNKPIQTELNILDLVKPKQIKIKKRNVKSQCQQAKILSKETSFMEKKKSVLHENAVDT
jgi:hypothetical protein